LQCNASASRIKGIQTMMKLSQKNSAKRLDVRVVGVGGAGCSSLGRVAESLLGSGDMSLMAIDTGSAAHALIGTAATLSLGNGFGSGGDPLAAVELFREVEDDVERFVSGADVVIVLAGLGRGTGSGISPLVAEIGRNVGALVIAAVNMPFEFEGRFRNQSANNAHDRLMGTADAVVTINNSDLSKLSGESGSLNGAFQEADRQIADTVYAFTTALTASSDRFVAVQLSLRGAGDSLVVRGSSEGLHAGRTAIADAFGSTEVRVTRARSAVIHVEGGIGLSLGQVAEAVTEVRGQIGRDADVHVSSERRVELGQRISVTVVLAGIGENSDSMDVANLIVGLGKREAIPSLSIFDTAAPIRKRGPTLLPTV
jgi:cell division protein FtsZ